MKRNSEVNESELVRQIKGSSESAFKTLYFNYAEKLYHYFWGRLSNPDLARDFVQELFLRIWATRDRLEPDKGIKAYLYRIAEHMLIDHFRKQASRRAYQRAKQLRHAATPHQSPDRAFQLKWAIDSLPEKVKATFLLKLNGLTQAETARVQGISVKTVEKRLQKARILLRKALR